MSRWFIRYDQSEFYSEITLYWQVLQEKDIHIWDGNASREYLDRQAWPTNFCRNYNFFFSVHLLTGFTIYIQHWFERKGGGWLRTCLWVSVEALWSQVGGCTFILYMSLGIILWPCLVPYFPSYILQVYWHACWLLWPRIWSASGCYWQDKA